MKNISTILAIVLIIILVLGPISILKEIVFPNTTENTDTRIHMNTGNTIRISAKDSNELGIDISNTLYPANNNEGPKGVILINTEKWQDVLALTPLARLYQSPIIPIPGEINNKTISAIKALSPKGIASLNNTQVLIFSNNNPDLSNDLSELEYEVNYIAYENLNQLQNTIYSLPNIVDDMEYGFIVSDDTPYSAIPVGTWLARKNGLLMFTDNDGTLYPSTKKMLNSMELKKVYLIGNAINAEKEIIDTDILIGRINANSPKSFAISLAEFYEPQLNIGWNATRERNDSGHNFILNSTENPFMAATSIQLAVKGKAGPILWSDQDRLSPLTENYLWKMKPNYWQTPAEGPFNHVWIIGNTSHINWGTQARVDFTQEIASYEMMGEQGVGGLDVLAILWALASLGGAIWVYFHMELRMKQIYILTKLMWILAILLLGPVGIWIYMISYRDRPWMKMANNMIWQRPLWNQGLVATIMGLAFGASTMIVTAYLIALRGMFILPFSSNNGLYLLGNQMILQMIIAYIVAFIINSTIFMPTFLMRMRKLSYGEGVKNSIPTVLISMTSVSIGMMVSMWWLHMVYSPMMPEENHILWWGFMQLATLIGLLTGYIPNLRLVRYGRKMGVS